MQLRGFGLVINPMSKRYYRKELPEAPVFIAGHPFTFEVYATEDPKMIEELDRCATRGVGGVIAITEEEFKVADQKKTIESGSGSSFKQQNHNRVEISALRALHAVEGRDRGIAAGTFNRPHNGQPNTLPASGRPMPDPISVPSPNQFSGIFLKPPSAKLSDVKAAAKTP